MIFYLKIITIKRWPLCCLLFFHLSCNFDSQHNLSSSAKIDSIKQEQKIDDAFNAVYDAKKYIKQGDVILRTGKDFTSEIMRHLSVQEKTFSHCGIACYENDTLFVYHAIGGEWNPDQKLRRDPFELFCNPYENRGFGIFRYGLSKNELEKLFIIIRNFYSYGIMFDMQFDLSSDDRMYCSEFIYKTIEKATDHRIIIPTTTLNNIKFIAADNVYINTFCKEIKRVRFKKE